MVFSALFFFHSDSDTVDAADAAPNAVWKKNFGSTGGDLFTDMIDISDGYVIVGNSTTFNNYDWSGVTGKGNQDAIVIKFDLNGNVVWKKNFGGSGRDYFTGVAAVSDGYVAVGISYAESFGNGDWSGVTGKGGRDAIIVKFDLNGNVLWKKSFGGSGEDEFMDVTATSGDGEFVAVGNSDLYAGGGDWTGHTTTGMYDGTIVKFDIDGNAVWKYNFGGSSNDQFLNVTEVSDGFVAVGYSTTFRIGDWSGVTGKGSTDAIIVKFDTNGNVVWKKNFGGSDQDTFDGIAEISDGGFVAVGYSYLKSFGNGDWSGVTGKGGNDAIIVKFDTNGNVVWKKNFGGTGNDTFNGMTGTSDGGFVAVGSSGAFGSGDWSGVAGKGQTDGIIVKFGLPEYDVIYNTNGGNMNGPANDTGIVSGTMHALNSVTKPTRTGHVFMGWSSTQTSVIGMDGTLPSTITNVPITDANITVYAVWGTDTNGNGIADCSEQTYTVTYDANGGTGGPLNEEGSLPGTYALGSSKPSRAEHVFMGWSETRQPVVDKDGTLPSVVANVTITNADVTVYAVWAYDTDGDGIADLNETKYSVTYDVNGGTGGLGIIGGFIPGKYTLNIAEEELPSRAGHVFMGWSLIQTSVVGKEDTVPDTITNVTITNADVTVYAVWGTDTNGDGIADADEQTYTVTYDANGGSAVTGISDVSGAIISAPVSPARTGYTFVGWYETDGYDNGGVWGNEYVFDTMPSFDLTLYAKWDASIYTITFDHNGADGGNAVTETAVAYGSEYGELPSPSKTGYTFAGWYTSADGGDGELIEPSSLFVFTEDRTLYARWSANSYTIVYERNAPSHAANAVTGDMGAMLLRYDETNALTVNSYGLEGWRFGGWTRNQNGSGTSYADGQTDISNLTAADGGTVRLYAKWIAVTYVIAYDSNAPVPGVTGNTADSVHVYDDPEGISYNGYALDGYRFAGWNTEADGTGTSYADGQTVSNLAITQNKTIRFYAVWEKLEFDVIFRYFDETTGQYAVHGEINDVAYGTLISSLIPDTVPNAVSDTGGEYVFIRWDGYANSEMRVTGDHTFTAIFGSVPSVYTITFLDADGESVIEEVTAAEGTYIHTIIPSASDLSENFVRWDGLEAWMTVTGEHVFRAVYSDNAEHVTHTLSFFDDDGSAIYENEQAIEGTSVSAYLPAIPSKTGYVFLGWNGYAAGMVVTGDHAFTAVYKENDPSDPPAFATITFVSEETSGMRTDGRTYTNGSGEASGSANHSAQAYRAGMLAQNTKVIAGYDVPIGTMISMLVPAAPYIDGKTFAGWKDYSPSMTATGDLVFTAIYVSDDAERYTVRYYGEDGIAVLERVTDISDGTAVSSILPPDPSKPGYVFTGWNGYVSGMTVESDLVFTATYRRDDSQTYTVTFIGIDDNVLYERNGVVHGTVISMILPHAPDIEGKTFVRWDGYESWMTAVTSNLVFKAVYEEDTVPHYEVTFYGENGTDVIAYRPNVPEGASVSSLMPQTPVKTGYVFAGWKYRAAGGNGSDDGNGSGEWLYYAQGMTVTFDVTFVAIYAENGATRDIKFYNDGRYMTGYGVTEGMLVAMLIPPSPSKPGYVFAGWLYLSDVNGIEAWYDVFPGMTVTSDLMLKSKWNVTGALYDLAANGAYGSGRYEAGSNVTIVLDIPAGKRFLRWNVISGNAAPSVPVNGFASFTMPSSDAEFEAVYENIVNQTYNVTVSGGVFAVNGTAANGSAPNGGVEYGSAVRLFYSEPENMRFVRFASTDVSITYDVSGCYFVMPSKNVTIVAEYEPVSAGGGNGTGITLNGNAVTIAAFIAAAAIGAAAMYIRTGHGKGKE